MDKIQFIKLLVIIEAELATTQLIELVIRACHRLGISYEKRLLKDLQLSDFKVGAIPLFIRCGDPLARAWTRTLAKANRTYAYYLDDNFWRIEGDTLLAAYYRHPAVRRALEFSVSNARMVITNSEELARFLSRFNKQTVVLPTFFDFSLLNDHKKEPDVQDEIRIGFAGSVSRVRDLDLIAPVLPRILEQFPRAIFEFIGACPSGVKPSSRVRFFPPVGDYANYVRFQQDRQWAIGLAPLLDNEANRSKTDNKFREYGAFKCAGIYADMSPYNTVVENHVTGLLVANTENAWFGAISTLITDHKKRTAISENAFNAVKTRYDISNVSERWAHLFRQLASQHDQSAQLLDGRYLRGLKLRRERLALHIHIIYQTGGVVLVGKHAIGKLLHIALRVRKHLLKRLRGIS